MSKTGTVCSVAGMEVQAIVRYVTGYQAGAKWMNEEIETLNVYVPSFTDPAKGREAALEMIAQGCDVVFGVGAKMSHGGLLAAKEKGLMVIGLDMDQYLTYPDVQDAMLTSAMKNVDVSVYNYLKSVKEGKAKAGIVMANVQNGGVGLAPYRDWERRIPGSVKARVAEAMKGLADGTISTRYEKPKSPHEGKAAGEVWVRPKDEAEMVWVPAGQFEMGSADGEDNEKPVHKVTLDGYWIDKTEVTNAQFARFVEVTVRRTAVEVQGGGLVLRNAGWEQTNGANWRHPGGPETGIKGLESHPVVQVGWNDAAAYCKWAGARLPTEAEWEYAARGRLSRAYPWGSAFDGKKLNYCDRNCILDFRDMAVDDGYAKTAPVGRYPGGASWVGALDMAGNVWEWVIDWHSDDYYARSPARNPAGPDSGEFHTLRGGSWDHTSVFARSTFRGRFQPDGGGGNLGFRCAKDAVLE